MSFDKTTVALPEMNRRSFLKSSAIVAIGGASSG